jgi:hypothetical protein
VPAGAVLLGLAAYVASRVWPGGMTLVGWLAQISLTGFTLLMLIPYAPRLAVRLSVAGGLLWMLVAWV